MPGLRPPERDIGVADAPIRSSFALLGIFGVLFLAFALIERLGLSAGFMPVAVILSALVLFALVGIASHGRRPVDYYVADRSVPAALGGLAAASGVAGLLVIGVAGGGFDTTADIMISAAGLLTGCVVAALLFAPGLRRVGAYTATDLFAARFGGGPARLLGALVAFISSLLILVAHLATTGPLLATLIGLTQQRGFYLAAGLTALAVAPGGMRSLTWTQMIQFLVIVAACLVPAGFLTAFGAESGAAGNVGLEALRPFLLLFLSPFEPDGLTGAALPIAALAVGMASLAPVLARALAAPDGREARASLLWACIIGLALVAGVLVLSHVIANQAGAQPPTSLGGDPLLLATPIFAGLPSVLAGLVMAALLTAALAAGQAALLSAASALSHDVWHKLVDQAAPEGRRLFMARLLVILVAAIAAWIAPFAPIGAPALIGWALALAAAGNFVPLLLGIWWRNATAPGAMAGMCAGFGSAALMFVFDLGSFGQIGPLPAVGPIQATAIAVPVGLAVAVLVSLLTRRWEEGSDAETDDLFATLHHEKRKPPMRERPA